MLELTRTHREVKKPQITTRYLADYMAATERARRTIIRGCKYQPVSRIVQHDEAKMAISRSLWDQKKNRDYLLSESRRIRAKMADSEFDRDVNDHNAEYIERFVKMSENLSFPQADFSAPGKRVSIQINGVKIGLGLHLRLQRTTRTNKVRTGAASLRYSKGKALPDEVGQWQSAFIFGYLATNETTESREPEYKLCLTIDAYRAIAIPSPTDAIARYRNMEAACATIAERWDNIQPPPNAIL